VLFAVHQQMIEALAAKRFHEPVSEAIRRGARTGVLEDYAKRSLKKALIR
jgi:hypothetical protein